MRSETELRQLYESEFKTKISAMEKVRKTTAILTGITILIVLACLYLMVSKIIKTFAGAGDTGFFSIMFVFPAMLFIFLMIFIVKAVKHKYSQGFKKDVVIKVLDFMNPEWTYESMSYISRKDFLESKIGIGHIDEYFGEDLISGVIEGKSFQCSELRVMIKHASGVESEIFKGSETLFDGLAEKLQEKFPDAEVYRATPASGDIRLSRNFIGLFIVTEFDKSLNYETFVVPKKLFTTLTGKKEENIKGYGELIKFEHPEFEEVFSVYSNGEDEARYIMTSSMMNTMLRLQKEYDYNMKFSFKDSKVYCAIESREDFFEPKTAKEVKFEDVKEIYSLFEFIENLVKAINS